MKQNNNEAFFALLRGGLWEKDVRLFLFGKIAYEEVMQLAEEQSVVGLVTAGMEHVKDVCVPQDSVLQFVGLTIQEEQCNTAMNIFIADMVKRMRKADIYTLLVKGQGIAQCYERPLWRSCGDIDLLLCDDSYQKAKALLIPLASGIEPEGKYEQHLSLTIDSWTVELHGSLKSGLSSRIDKVLEEIKNDIFYGGGVRSWNNGNTQVFLPSADDDAIYLFTHILQHFYKGGIGLRQICDWCRLLWTFRDSLNHKLLESRIRKMALTSEWKAFGALAVNWLGMPVEAMPLYNDNDNLNVNLKRKAERIRNFILMSGNFGHNRDMSYYDKYPYLVRKVISLGRRCGDLFRHARIFPMDSIRFSFWIMLNGLRSAVRGE